MPEDSKNNIPYKRSALEIAPPGYENTGSNIPAGKGGSARRSNILKAVRFDRPDYIPMIFHINESSWDHYQHDFLNELIESHSFLFQKTDDSIGRVELDYRIIERIDTPFTDGWGCVWQTTQNGIVGTVTYHPLKDWDNFDNFKAPDPNVDSGKGPVVWKQVRDVMSRCRKTGHLALGGLRHGHTFQTLTDIRGYENLMLDMYDNDPRLMKLIDIVEEFNLALVKKYLDCGVEWMSYPDDLGMQVGPMISPELFLKYIKPSYCRLIKPASDKNCVIHMHSDGDIRNLTEYIVDSGVHVLNLQDTVNDINWIKSNLSGKICVDLDIDRQSVTRTGTVDEIDAFIRNEVETLGSKQGGLMMIYGLYPGLPIENVKAVMDAMERYAFYYSG